MGIVTFISVTGVFGKTNSEVSALYQTLITPAGFTFSIWGLIFTAELLFVVAQCSSGQPASRSRSGGSFSPPNCSSLLPNAHQASRLHVLDLGAHFHRRIALRCCPMLI